MRNRPFITGLILADGGACAWVLGPAPSELDYCNAGPQESHEPDDAMHPTAALDLPLGLDRLSASVHPEIENSEDLRGRLRLQLRRDRQRSKARICASIPASL